MDVGALHKNERAFLEECLSRLAETYRVTPRPRGASGIKALCVELDLLRLYAGLAIIDVWRAARGPGICQVFFYKIEQTFEKATQHGISKSTVRELRAGCVVDTNMDFGHVLIRPESIGDKLMELFVAREVDFPEHPEFSHRNYVLASDENKLRRTITFDILDTMHRHPGFTIEAKHGKLLILQPKIATAAMVEKLAAFGCDLAPTLK